LLGTHRELFVRQQSVVANLILVLNTRGLYTLILSSIISSDVTFLGADVHAHLLLLLHPTLSCHTMIVLLVTLKSIMALDRTLVHRYLVAIRILAVAESLPPILVLDELLLLSLLHLLVVATHRIL
jgi:hypothetical protein